MHSFVISTDSLIPKPATNVLIIKSETTIGIEDIRQIQSFLATKPIGGDKNKVYLLAAESLTVPAQNALLKTLEEPPGDSEVYLVTDQPEQLLSTVLSRVQVNQTTKTEASDTSKSQKLLERLLKAKLGERLGILDEEKFTREQLLKFMSDLEQLIHQDLSLAKLYLTVVQMKKYLKANCNLRLCLAFLASNI